MKKALTFLLLLWCIFGFCKPVMAESADIADEVESLYEQSGMDEVESLLSEDTLELLYGLGISPQELQSLADADAGNLLAAIWEMAVLRLKKPFMLLGSIIGLLLLSAILTGLQSERFSIPPGILLSLGTVGIMGRYLVELLRQIKAVVESVCSFVEGFVPVYAGVFAALGQTGGALGLSGMAFGTAVVICELMGKLILPMLSVYLALVLVCSGGEVFDMGGFTQSVSQTAGWILGLAMSIFSLVLGVQKMMAQVNDTLGMKTAKLAMSTFVPVVGGPLADALSSVTTGLQLLKASMGGFALLALALEFLPVVFSLTGCFICLKAAQGIASLCQIEAGKKIYTAVSNGIGLLLAVVLSAAAALIMALAIFSYGMTGG